MKRTAVLIMLLCCVTLVAPGCISRMIDEGVERGLGPTAKALPMEPKWPEEDTTFLAAYRNFELVLPVKSEFADTPKEFMDYFPVRFGEHLASKDLPTGRDGKTLLVDVTILAYQAVVSYHKAWGPTEEVVARVELKDKDTGKIIGRAVCIGRTYQSIGLGHEWKAWGLCRAIINDWINEYYPKEGRKEGQENPPPTGK